jgi:hypothetical protein
MFLFIFLHNNSQILIQQASNNKPKPKPKHSYKMDSQTSTVNNNQKTPKTLPIKYKSMLYASIHIIHKYLPAELWESIYEKLPLYGSVEEQMQYFDTHCDMKKIETELYKPMVKEHVKREKLLNKPVKEKKPRPPRAPSSSSNSKKKKSVAAAVDANITALETTFSSLSVEENPVATTTAEPEPPILMETAPIPPPSSVQAAAVAVEDTTTKDQEKAKTKRKTVAKKPTNKPDAPPADTEVVSNPIPTPSTTTTTTTTTEKKPKAPRKKKETAVPQAQPAQPAAVEEEEVRTTPNEAAIEDTLEEPDMFLFIHNGQRYWTTDEHFQNGYLYGSHKNEDGDTVPNSELVGRLVDGVANLF